MKKWIKYYDACCPGGRVKNGQAPLIASLQPSTLASFPTWGISKGADRKRLARANVTKDLNVQKGIVLLF